MAQLVDSYFLVLGVALLCCPATCQDHCNPRTGPAGQTICFYDTDTGKLGWFSCVPNSYIITKSKGGSQCDNGYPYCLYGCLDEGVLTNNCECSEATEYMPPDPAVPAWCYDPPAEGDLQCLWYQQCLDKKQPCEDSDNGYALAYGERFCNLYTSNVEASLFSQHAVDWIDAVRRCLQAALVPLLRPWHSPTCEQIKDIAFASHTGCYLAPSPDAPGICSLGFRDWLAVFWTVKGSFISVPGATLKGIVETGAGCAWTQDLKLHPFRWLRLGIRFSMFFRGKRSTSEVDFNTLSGEIVDKIALRYGWDSRTLNWFGYVQGAVETDDAESIDIINLLVVDKLSFGLTTAPDAPLVNLTDTVRQLVDAIQNGTLRELQLGSGNVTITSITECSHLGCPQAQKEGTTPPGNSAPRRTPHRLSFLFFMLIHAALHKTTGHVVPF